jgi:RNase P subunit RPR2
MSAGCAICGKAKTTLDCAICESRICKNCAEFITPETFQYADVLPPKMEHTNAFCSHCYTTDVLPAIQTYEDMVAVAKDIRIFDRTQTKETRFIKRLEDPIYVSHCLDAKEATMKLAFIAARMNYNSIVDVEIKTVKIRNGSYQTSEASGTGIPTNVDDSKLMKDRSFTDPN